jgi:hypothetical protein
MLKQPLFGQDSSPHRTSFFISLLSTFIFWVLFTVMAIFVKIDNPSPQFKTVQIVLDSSLPLEQTEEAESEFTSDIENAVAESEAVAEEIVAEASPVIEESFPLVETVEPVVDIPEPKVEETPVVETPKPLVEKPAPVIEKPAPAKKEPVVEKKQEPVKEVPKVEKIETKPAETTPVATDESKKVDYALQKSVEELMEEQMANKKTRQDFNWDMFDDDSSSAEKTTSSDSKKVTTSSSTAGSAANTASQESARQTSNSDSAKKNSATASQSTSSDLDKIAKAESKSGSGTKTDIAAKTSKDGSGKVMMEMADGSKRALMRPKEPAINLSEQAAQTFTLSKATVKITFKVVQKGNVPRTEIKITPESILTESIRKEIIDQLSQWIFEEADFDGTATFEYTIEKR